MAIVLIICTYGWCIYLSFVYNCNITQIYNSYLWANFSAKILVHASEIWCGITDEQITLKTQTIPWKQLGTSISYAMQNIISNWNLVNTVFKTN